MIGLSLVFCRTMFWVFRVSSFVWLDFLWHYSCALKFWVSLQLHFVKKFDHPSDTLEIRHFDPYSLPSEKIPLIFICFIVFLAGWRYLKPEMSITNLQNGNQSKFPFWTTLIGHAVVGPTPCSRKKNRSLKFSELEITPRWEIFPLWRKNVSLNCDEHLPRTLCLDVSVAFGSVN